MSGSARAAPPAAAQAGIRDESPRGRRPRMHGESQIGGFHGTVQVHNPEIVSPRGASAAFGKDPGKDKGRVLRTPSLVRLIFSRPRGIGSAPHPSPRDDQTV